MTSPVKFHNCFSVSGHHTFVQRTHLYFGLPVRLLLLVLLGFIGVAGHEGNFKTTTTNYEDIHQSPFLSHQELEFHTEKLFEQSNFSLPKHSTTNAATHPHHHKHLEPDEDQETYHYTSGKPLSQSNSSLRRENQNAKKKTHQQKSTDKNNSKGHGLNNYDDHKNEDTQQGYRFSGGQDFPDDHEFPGGHDFHQGHRSHHSEPLTMAHRLDDEFKRSTSVPVVPIQLPPPNDTIHYHYTDDEDSEFYHFSKMTPSPSHSTLRPSNSLKSNKTMKLLKNTSTSSALLSTPLIQFDTYENDKDETKARVGKGRKSTTNNNKNNLTIRASTKSKSKSQQSQQSKPSKDSRKRITSNLNSPLELETSSSETFPRIHYGNREHPKSQKLKKGGSQSKFYRNDPKLLYDESPFHLNKNSQSHDEDHDDQSKQYNYYITKNKKGNELRKHNHADVNDYDHEYQKTSPNVKQLSTKGEERESIGDTLDLHHNPRQKHTNKRDDKHFEKSGDESKHVEEVADFESKKISKISQNKSSKVPNGSGSSKTVKNDPFKGNSAMTPIRNTNATSNSLEDLEDDFDYSSRDDESNSSLMRRRPRRSVVHLYDMVVCATGCNPLAYKGYGCYCGFLGSGLTVDGIDRCCAKHDWCYHHAKCPPLLTYFVPYYWTCNAGRPKCVTDYRGWKGICGANLCECDRQFAECLRKFPCPRSRAMCMTSPWRFWQNLLMTPPMRYGYDDY